MTDVPRNPKPRPPMTDAGNLFLDALTGWLQDVRFAGEAIYRLSEEYRAAKSVSFSPAAWPPPAGQTADTEFTVSEPHLSNLVDRALRVHWETRFVFLETLWEEYLQNLILEIRVKNVTVFEEFSTRDFMVDLMRQIISDKWASVDDIKIEVASRFAAELTHKSWEHQWKDLARLSIGIGKKPPESDWYKELESYFEMRNCIIHRNGRASARLREVNPYYADHEFVNIFPTHLGHYRHAFIQAVIFIDTSVLGKLNS